MYNYTWTGPSSFTSNVQNPTGLQAGVYNVTTTDANGCITSSSITLTEPDVMSLAITSPTYAGGYNISCNGSNNGAINLTNGGGTPSYTYSWTGPSSYTSTVQNPSGLIAGSYSVSITDANACVISSTITLTQPAPMAGSINSPTVNGGYNITCNGLSNGAITQTLTGGTLPYTINWSNGASTQNLSNVPAGTYSVIIIDANNCTITQTITLTEPPTVFASATSPSFNGGYNITCNGNSTGTITLGAIGGTLPYTYNWNGPSSFTSTSQNLSNVIAGTYSATVTDANGCNYTTTISLTQPATLAASLSSYTFAGGYNISCNGYNTGAITSTVTGGTQSYQYLWNGPASYTSTSASISGLIAGAYTVNITDTNNCVTSVSINLTEPAALNVTSTSTVYTGGYNVSCNGYNNANINLTVTGGTSAYTYSWTGPASYTASSQNINALYAGTYSVVVTDANNCSFNLSQTLTEPSAINDTLIASLFIGGTNLSCFNSNNGTLQVNSSGGTGPFTQVWTGPAAFTSTATSISGLAAGTYSVLITDANGCLKQDTITMTQPAVFTQTLTTSTYIGGFNIRCKGDSSGVVYNSVNGGTPGFTYLWSGPSGFTANTEDINNIIAGTYTVVATDTNGCVSTATINITEPAVALTGTLSVTHVACTELATGSISLTVNGGTSGYIYWWRGPGNYTSSNQNNSGLFAGLYDVVVTDTNGCQISIDTTITEPKAISVTYTTTNPVCKGVSNGSIDITLSGGVVPFTYNWSNGSSSEDPNNLAAGTYTLIYTCLLYTSRCV